MHSLLEFFRLGDVVPLLLLICLLRFVGTQLAGDSSAVYRCALGFAAVGFLLYAGFAVAEWTPTTALGFLIVGVQALLAMGTVNGLALVTLPVLRFFYMHLWARPLERLRVLDEARARQRATEQQQREAAERAQAEREQQAEEQRRRQEEEARRPLPPTREELLAAAQKRYESTIKLLESATLDETERRAAKERAKQQYLRELDEVMK